MSHNPKHGTRRATIGRIVAGSSLHALAAGSLLSASTAGAGTSTIITIKSVSPHLVAASTANQVITVTGTGFDEAAIISVALSNAGTCPTSFIVVSPTVIVVKTTAATCTATVPVLTVTDTSGNTVVNPTTGTAAVIAAGLLSFVTPPDIAATTTGSHPVTTDNTATLAYAAQTTNGLSASIKGGTTIRVTGGLVPFATSTATPLSATLSGVSLTGIKITGSAAGNYFTGVVGAHAADAAPVLKVTNNGVSKSFAHAAVGASTGTHEFTYDGSSITVSPTSGPSNGGTLLTITGTGFDKANPGNNTVTFGTVGCTLGTGITAPTATSIKCTTFADVTPFEGAVTVKVVVSSGLTSVASVGSTFTYLAQ